ncbi:phenylalanine ammonia-lyase [Laetiporus sulphureus 93-53]|uniref:Phenylalanine ammonia-lyase n=1 Tax=Laetiporus sulphureus 93-53 TaxID=1314785 RepID=A0A165BQ89_9APHY|nr:phenylalanine ammonia-lyase [Laetiporus sulphureus 93-53]KZT01457.1 phenylalanine ammonia-lyase [Laetiporus sulphureus 93-53]
MPSIRNNGYVHAVPATPLAQRKVALHGNGAGRNGHADVEHHVSAAGLLTQFIEAHHQLEAYKNGKAVVVDGKTLSVPAVTAAARYGADVTLDESSQLKEQVARSRAVIVKKVEAETSVYGVSTGFGGSADTRTNDPIMLGHALLQHQHVGVLPSQTDTPTPILPLTDPLASTSMPEAWVRGAILIRMNSLIRGHSGVRWELIEKMGSLLRESITPLVPLRGSISASGDLSPLSYIAGTLTGNPSIRVFDGPAKFGPRQIVASSEALAAHGIEPIPLASKEHLGILNGTAFSASVAALALHEAVHLAMLAQVCTAMGTEALLGTQGSFEPFIHDVARPHPGQVESAANIRSLLEGTQLAVTKEEERNIKDDAGELRQDRYPLRTAAQFLGPQIEDILSALGTVTLECNTTTDNPLIEAETDTVHHGGNFQAMAVTNAMEKTRLALHHIGKLLFAQCTEILNPTMNRGLPPSVAATDPSLNYHAKGLDIHVAAYVGELGYLANPVSTHVQSAEMHNQAVNSLALISGRATINSLEVLSLITASYLYILCQAVDLRAMQNELQEGMKTILREQLDAYFGSSVAGPSLDKLFGLAWPAIGHALDATSTMDAKPRMHKVASACMSTIVDFCIAHDAAGALGCLSEFRDQIAEQSTDLLVRLREAYLRGERGATPSSAFLGKTRVVYEFVRVTLGVRMHGVENLDGFAAGPGVVDSTVGKNISLIHEAIRDGKLQSITVSLFE